MVDQQPPQPPQAAPPKKGWLGRNWIWFVPTGCFALLVLVIGGCVATIVFGATGMMKSSDAYKGAMMKVNASEAAQAALGTPIEAGLMVSGNISINNDSGQAELSIPVSGPKGSGKLIVNATKTAGAWTFNTLVLNVASGESIDLTGPQPTPDMPAIPLTPPAPDLTSP